MSEQSVVKISVNGRHYAIGCDPGEEEHIERLAADVEEVLRSLVEKVGRQGEARLLVMAALMLADRAREGGGKGDGDAEQRAAAALDGASERILELASRVASH